MTYISEIGRHDFSHLIKRIEVFFEVMNGKFNEGTVLDELIRLLESIIKLH
jgi:hypothetical protein